MGSKKLEIEVNKNILEMEYAVRGPIPQRALELSNQGVQTIPCNIGNPQALGQAPMSYYRQILSLVEDSSLIQREKKLKALVAKNPTLTSIFEGVVFHPDDILKKAESFLSQSSKGTGAYTESNGPQFIRESVAKFIDQRDQSISSSYTPSNPNQIYITNGASEGVKYIIDILISKKSDGIMIPIPQYPLYSATICKAGGTQINYYPDEDQDWLINKEILETSYNKAIADGVTVKAIAVINPGNPTGAILDKQTVDDVINFAQEHNIAIIADEVYQENVYGADFISFASMLGEREVPLFSFHSVSKGFYGECGHRGGYMEVRNPPMAVGSNLSLLEVIQKQASVSLCSNTVGQLLVWLMVTPPVRGATSYDPFIEEKNNILNDLQEKATLIREAFTQMKGVEVFGRTGAMYLFPRLNILPANTTDFDYCMALLEETGLTTVNGSGFGQVEGTHHLRIAFLPPKEMLAEVLPKWIKFHNNYVK